MVCKETPLSLCIVTVLLGVWTEVTRGEARIQLTPQHPGIGGSVTLTVTGITGRIQYITWFKEAGSNHRILTYITGPPPKQYDGPQINYRMKVSSSGSLRISNLNRADEGQYRATIQADSKSHASVYLPVYEAVGKPTITPSSSQPEEYDMLTLTCTSSNAERITWSRVSGSMSSGVTFSSDNKTLTWPRITRTDTGAYQCKGENPMSSSVSDPYTLTVSNLVGKPTITPSSSQPEEYDRVTLTCTFANSERITWSRVSGSISSGVTFSSDNKTLTWPRITRTDTGAYQCQGENRFSSSISDPYTLTVSYGPDDIKIIKQMFGNASILLECLAESVPPPDYQWTLSGTNVTHRQETLHVDQSKPENTGTYMCVATNSVTQKTARASINVLGTSVSPQPEFDSKTVMIMGMVIAVALLIVIGVSVYIFLIPRCKKEKNSTTEAKNPSSTGPPILRAYENATAAQMSMPERSMQATEMYNTVATAHYTQLGPQDNAVYSTLMDNAVATAHYMQLGPQDNAAYDTLIPGWQI